MMELGRKPAPKEDVDHLAHLGVKEKRLLEKKMDEGVTIHCASQKGFVHKVFDDDNAKELAFSIAQLHHEKHTIDSKLVKQEAKVKEARHKLRSIKARDDPAGYYKQQLRLERVEEKLLGFQADKLRVDGALDKHVDARVAVVEERQTLKSVGMEEWQSKWRNVKPSMAEGESTKEERELYYQQQRRQQAKRKLSRFSQTHAVAISYRTQAKAKRKEKHERVSQMKRNKRFLSHRFRDRQPRGGVENFLLDDEDVAERIEARRIHMIKNYPRKEDPLAAVKAKKRPRKPPKPVDALPKPPSKDGDKGGGSGFLPRIELSRVLQRTAAVVSGKARQEKRDRHRKEGVAAAANASRQRKEAKKAVARIRERIEAASDELEATSAFFEENPGLNGVEYSEWPPQKQEELTLLMLVIEEMEEEQANGRAKKAKSRRSKKQATAAAANIQLP